MYKNSTIRAWFVTLIAALFFFFVFIQVNIFNSISAFLLKDFSVNAAQLGQLSSYYFIANILLLFPAGIILDRFSPKKIIVIAMLLCVSGTAIFALATEISLATVGRFMVGIGGTFSFLSCMKIASRWMPPQRLALVTGVIVTMAMLGGMVAQTPLVIITDHFGWRQALYFDIALGLIITVLIAIFVRDYPSENKEEIRAQSAQLSSMGFFHALGKVVLNLQNWLGGLYTSLMNFPIFLLGAMWGELYLVQAAHLSRTQASYVTSMLFIGMIIGSPFFGWLSDRIGRRKLPMLIAAILAFVIILPIMYIPTMTLWTFLVLSFLLGFIIGAQVIGYPLVAESNPLSLTGTSVGLASVLIMSGGLTQTLFGWLLGMNWQHTIVDNTLIYSLTDYRLAMLIMPVSFMLALVVVLLSKETYCKNIGETRT